MWKILIVDDDAQIRKLVRVNLEGRGYTVQEAVDGEDAITRLKSEAFDLLILDLVMPGMSGIDVCAWVRERSDTPVIVLSAHDEEELKVRALDAGADDFVTKPFGHEELLARIRAVRRRVPVSMQQPQQPSNQIKIDGLVIGLDTRRAFVDGNEMHLTRTEFALLAELAQNLDSVITHEELLARVWGPEYRESSHYLHVYLGRIRQKLGAQHSELLETVPGIGYILHSARRPTMNQAA
jgi:two-component system, OmpR family, KDP operon response regulator KdpE